MWENFQIVFLIVAFTLGVGGALLAVLLGFKMGRKTQGADNKVFETEIKNADKDKIDGLDIFSEHVNDGLEGDPNGRIRTL